MVRDGLPVLNRKINFYIPCNTAIVAHDHGAKYAGIRLKGFKHTPNSLINIQNFGLISGRGAEGIKLGTRIRRTSESSIGRSHWLHQSIVGENAVEKSNQYAETYFDILNAKDYVHKHFGGVGVINETTKNVEIFNHVSGLVQAGGDAPSNLIRVLDYCRNIVVCSWTNSSTHLEEITGVVPPLPSVGGAKPFGTPTGSFKLVIEDVQIGTFGNSSSTLKNVYTDSGQLKYYFFNRNKISKDPNLPTEYNFVNIPMRSFAPKAKNATLLTNGQNSAKATTHTAGYLTLDSYQVTVGYGAFPANIEAESKITSPMLVGPVVIVGPSLPKPPTYDEHLERINNLKINVKLN